MIDPKRKSTPPSLIATVLRGAMLAALLAALAACGEHAFLDDFPPYAPTEPYLEEQRVKHLRVSALREEEGRMKDRYLTVTREESLRKWHELEEKQRRGVQRKEAEQERRARARSRTGPQNIDEWQRIMR